MRTEEFREWLKARRWNGKPLSTVNLRVSRTRRFEKAMPDLGLGVADLDLAFDADGMTAVTAFLAILCRAAVETGNAPEALVGDTTIPVQRINSLTAAVRNYRQFREAERAPQADWPELDALRAIFLDRVPEFERFTRTENSYERVERAYKDVIAQAVGDILQAESDPEQTGRRIYRALIPNQGPLLRWQTDDDFAKKFPALAPEFYVAIARLARDTRPIVDAIMDAAAVFKDLHSRGATTLTVGRTAAIAITVAGIVRPHDAAPFKMSKARELAGLLLGDPLFRGATLEREHLERWLELLRRIERVMLDRWGWEPRDLVDVQGFAWAALDEGWMEDDVADENEGDPVLFYDREGAIYRPWRQGNPPAFPVLPANPPSDKPSETFPVEDEIEMCRLMLIERRGVRLRKEGETWQNILKYPGQKLVAYSLRADIAEALSLPAVSGLSDIIAARSETSSATTAATPSPLPTNLILYGPPGTGKTYATAAHAVRLCGEEVPEDREALMAAYHRLVEAGRIEFVTFHQSIAYEDFVEGLRPPQGKGEPVAGFALEPTPGVFRRIARRAETSTGPGDTDFTVGERRVFKMSIGEAANPDDAHLFEEAIRQGHLILGFEDIDWSDARFDSRDAIMAAVREVAADPMTVTANSAAVQMPHIFRNWMRQGDWVVASKGNGLFRAIGVVTGDYRHAPREGGDYGHQRDVRWLWHDRAGVPVEEIYARGFSMRSVYELTKADLNLAALERYANSQTAGSGAPESFVLVIDEINRANISKVFGELITLLEGDKRLGQANALKVRLPYSGDMFGVPANLNIIGTMNTADRSIALLDTALRRRFAFEELMPRPDLLPTVDGIDLGKLLATLNERIEYLFDREHQVGHAYFIGCRTRGDVDAVMRHKVIPLLAEYFYEDWGKVAAVLGDAREGEGGHDGGFLRRVQLKPPAGLGAEGEAAPRYRWSVREGAFDYAGLPA